MPPDTKDIACLWDILSVAEGIVLSVAGLKLKHYVAVDNLRMAVQRRVEIIGEAARRASEEFRQAHPQILWRDLVSQRNVLAHRYDEFANDAQLIRRIRRGVSELSTGRYARPLGRIVQVHTIGGV